MPSAHASCACSGDNVVAIDLITEHIRMKLQQHDLRRIYPNLEVGRGDSLGCWGGRGAPAARSLASSAGGAPVGRTAASIDQPEPALPALASPGCRSSPPTSRSAACTPSFGTERRTTRISSSMQTACCAWCVGCSRAPGQVCACFCRSASHQAHIAQPCACADAALFPARLRWAGGGGRAGLLALFGAHRGDAHGATVRGRGLCQEAVRRVHHPQWGEHGECAARLLQGHQDRQDPGAQVSDGDL